MNKRVMFIDVETTGLRPYKDKLHGLGVCYEEDEGEYYRYDAIPQSVIEDLANPAIDKIGHNIFFDLRFLTANGYIINGRIIDTLQMALLIDENRPLGLKNLSQQYLGYESLRSKRRLDEALSYAGVKKVNNLCEVDLLDPKRPYTDIIGDYCVEDVHNTFKLFFVLKDKLKNIDGKVKKILGYDKTPLSYLREEMIPANAVLYKMESRGVKVDLAKINAVRQEALDKQLVCVTQLDELCKEEIAIIEEKLYQIAVDQRKSPKGKDKVEKRSDKYKTKFNWQSNQHLGTLIYEYLGVRQSFITKTSSGQYKVNETQLKFLDTIAKGKLKEVLRIYAVYKKQQKIAATYTGTDSKGVMSHVVEKKTNALMIARDAKVNVKTLYTETFLIETAEPRNIAPVVHVEHRIYPEYLQRTVTGRLSSKSPNIQNLKRNSPVKGFFIPNSDNKMFVYADYSQIELRIAAHLSQDKKFLEAYENNLDLHCLTASQVFDVDPSKVSDTQRQAGKVVNFLLIYNGNASRLMQELKDKLQLDYTKEDCDRFRKNFYEYYAEYGRYLQSQLQYLRKNRLVISEEGRVRRLPEINYENFINHKAKEFNGPMDMIAKLYEPGERMSKEETYWRAVRKYKHAINQAYNFPVQSLGASIMKRALILLSNEGFDVVSTVHDSVVVEVEKSKWDKMKEVQEIMESAYPLSVPLKVDIKLTSSFDDKDVIPTASLDIKKIASK